MTPYEAIARSGQLVCIRPLFEPDYTAFVRGFAEQLPSQTPFDEGWFDTDFLTRAWFQAKLEERKELARRDQSYLFNVFRLSDGQSVGFCDITTHQRDCFQYARMGYTIFNHHWGKGYGRETARLLVETGFADLGFHRLEAHIDPANTRSKATAQSAGLTLEGLRKAFLWEDDHWADQEVWYILNNELIL